MTSYRASGVDLEAAADHVAGIEQDVTSTWTDAVVGGFGGFAAGVELPKGMEHPVIVASTDGVGTKLELARQLGTWSGVGHDLVAMCVDDLLAIGALPLGFTDYLAVGALDAARDRAIVASIAGACSAAGIPLLGGETAEHPGVMGPDQVDLAGTAIGAVERGRLIDGSTIEPGDVLVGLASRNVRSNGFSLVRSIVPDLQQPFEGRPIGATLLEPSIVFAPSVLPMLASIKGIAHVTGGGIAENLARVLPAGCGAVVDTGSWERPAIFGELARIGSVSTDEMFRVFNMGVGLILVAGPQKSTVLIEALGQHDAAVIGEVTGGNYSVRLEHRPGS